MKAYTDLEQSCKLTKILPPGSSDMYYHNRVDIPDNFPLPIEWKRGLPLLSQEIPCWSLAALLNVIPNYKLSSEHNYHTCTAETSFGKETVGWFDNSIDACVEMIIKLNEQKLL